MFTLTFLVLDSAGSLVSFEHRARSDLSACAAPPNAMAMIRSSPAPAKPLRRGHGPVIARSQGAPGRSPCHIRQFSRMRQFRNVMEPFPEAQGDPPGPAVADRAAVDPDD